MSDITPFDVLATLRLEDGRAWADAAARVQLEDARAFLAPDAPPYAFWTRARGYSKTADAAGITAGLMLTGRPGWRGYWLAADADQGALAIDSIAGYVARTPLLKGRLEVQARKVIAPATGAVLEVLAADAASAWGLRPDLVAADEFANWDDTPTTRRLWQAVSSATTKVSGARMLVVTTASAPSHPAYAELEHARTSPLWRVSETPGPPPWADPERLAEQRARLPGSIFRQLYENEWTEVEGAFLDPALVDACFTLPGPSAEAHPSARYAGGLDLGSTNDASVATVGHRQGEEVHLDRLVRWKGSKAAPVSFSAVTATVERLHQAFHPSILADPWQALHVAEELRRAGVDVETFTFTSASKQRLAQTLFQVVQDGRLKLYEADGLREEMKALRLVQTPGGAWTFDHTRRGHDDMAVAVALMVVRALEQSAPSTAYTDTSDIDRAFATAGDVAIHHGGLTLRGSKYLDRDAGGELVAPPGWELA